MLTIIISVVLSTIVSITITVTGVTVFLSKTNEIYEKMMSEFMADYSHKIKEITINAVKEQLERRRR